MKRDTRNPLLAALGVVLGAVLGAAATVVLRIAAAAGRGAAPERGGGTASDRTPPLPPPRREGWSDPLPARLIKPTYWPAVFALGIAFVFWGLISSLFITYIGLFLFVLGLANWIGEMRHDP